VKRHRALAALAVAGGALFVSPAAAQDAAPAPPPPAHAFALRAEQVSSFADVVGEPEGTVVGRLALDPNLVPLAAAAADARDSRKSTGKIMAITGFSILGVGDIVGAVVIAATPGYPNIRSDGWQQVGIGLGVALGALAVGLAIAIPGVVKMGKYSDAENAAVEYYERNGPNARPNQGPAVSTMKTTPGRLLSFTF
jgi:MFS family permease